MGFPGGSVVKNSPANAGDTRDVGFIPGPGRSPGKGNGNPLPVFLPGESPWTEEPGRIQFLTSKSWTWLNDSHSHFLFGKWSPPSSQAEETQKCRWVSIPQGNTEVTELESQYIKGSSIHPFNRLVRFTLYYSVENPKTTEDSWSSLKYTKFYNTRLYWLSLYFIPPSLSHFLKKLDSVSFHLRLCF